MIFKMHRRVYVILVVLSLCALMLIGANVGGARQTADVPVRLPFAPTEELVYKGEFTRSLLRSVDIAELRFTVALEPAGPTSKPQEKGEAGKSLRLTLDAVSKTAAQVFGLRSPAFESPLTRHLSLFSKPKRTIKATGDVRAKHLRRTAGQVGWTERDPNNPAKEPASSRLIQRRGRTWLLSLLPRTSPAPGRCWRHFPIRFASTASR